MGRALETIAGRATNPGTTITAVTMNTGDSATVRFFPDGTRAYLEQIWVDTDTLGLVRVRSPRLHDQAQAIRLQVPAPSRPLLPPGLEQLLYPQDLLTIEVTGDAAGTVTAFLTTYYEDLPGTDARLATWEEIAPRIESIYGSEQNLTTGATAGDWGGAQAASADQDQFKRGKDYALLGMLFDTINGAAGFTSTDTGNLRVAVPGALFPEITATWFKWLSQMTGRPHIPIINAANIGASTVDIAAEETATAIDVTLVLAELSGAAF